MIYYTKTTTDSLSEKKRIQHKNNSQKFVHFLWRIGENCQVENLKVPKLTTSLVSICTSY